MNCLLSDSLPEINGNYHSHSSKSERSRQFQNSLSSFHTGPFYRDGNKCFVRDGADIVAQTARPIQFEGIKTLINDRAEQDFG